MIRLYSAAVLSVFALSIWVGASLTEQGVMALRGFDADQSNGHSAIAVLLDLVETPIALPGGGERLLGVARHEVTHAEWQRCVDAGACRHQPVQRPWVAGNHPVSGVNWFDAQEYLNWLSQASGVRFRLPTEMEWRSFAAEVQAAEVDAIFDDPRLAWAAEYANYARLGSRETHPVGYFGATSTGIEDLDGNVWEWTESCWRQPEIGSESEHVADCGGVRVLAGTHVTYQSEFVRFVPTGGCSIGFPPSNIGLRVVRELNEADAPTDPPLALTQDNRMGGAGAAEPSYRNDERNNT